MKDLFCEMFAVVDHLFDFDRCVRVNDVTLLPPSNSAVALRSQNRTRSVKMHSDQAQFNLNFAKEGASWSSIRIID